MHKIINSIFSSNTYVIEVEDGLWLVDCGDLDEILTMGKPVKGVLLTHAHFDHIYGLPKLMEAYPDVKIYTSANGVIGLGSDKINFSRYHDTPLSITGDNIVAIGDGEEIELSDSLKAVAIATLGHDFSSICYIIGDCIFTGDSLIPGVKTVTTFPKSNKQQAADSEEKIKALVAGRGLVICPGHTVLGL